MERRSTRSDEPDMALRLFLHQRAQKQHIAALMLSDELGRLIASSGVLPEIEELAVLVPKLATRDPQGESLADQLGIPFYFRRVQIRGRKLFVGAIGDESKCRGALPEVDRGIRRILVESRVAC